MRKGNALFKYQIGLLFLGVLTLGLVAFLIVQANSSKQDTKTFEAATEAADKLNEYTGSHQTIPESLEEAGVHNAPKTITYEKLSDESYRFCVTYKTSNSTLDASSAINDALTGFYDSSFDYSSESDTYLFVDANYTKGENCQTIRPLLSNDSSNSEMNIWGTGGSELSTICGKQYSFSLDELTVSEISSTSITVDDFTALDYDLASDVAVFDANCKELSLADLSVGSRVTIYFDSGMNKVTAITKD